MNNKNKNKNPIISIIVPVYNVEQYLNRCIDSILAQTFTNFELILVNDGSSDNSGEICDEYKLKDNRIKVIHKKNDGVAEARNYGLDMAKGEYIGFVDSDDIIAPMMYEKLYELLIKYDGDISICNYQMFYDNIVVTNNNKSYIKEFDNINAIKNYMLEYGYNDKIIKTVIWDKLYKKSLFESIRFPKGKIYEDGYVTYKLIYNANKIIYINDKYYYYFQRNDSISRTKFGIKTLEVYDDWREIFLFFYENQKDISDLAVKFYVNKHIRTYEEIVKNKELYNVSKEYKVYIKRDLFKDLTKFIEVSSDKILIFRAFALCISYRLLKVIDKFIYLNKCIKFKISETINI